MEVSPSKLGMIILYYFLLPSLHLFLPTLSTNVLPYYDPTTMNPNDRNTLLRILRNQPSMAKVFQQWNSSSTECCVYCSFDHPSVPVSCDFQGRVHTLSLSSATPNESVHLPPDVAYLTSLVNLYVTGPGFTGPIPPAIGKLSESLQYLYIADTRMVGRLPGSLGRLRSLQRLQLERNEFSGHLPKSLSMLGNLWEMRLSGNRFCGRIPDVFANLTNLIVLDVSHNLLCGQIPDVTELTRLGTALFDHNKCLCGPPFLPPCK